MPELHETRIGRIFLEVTMPRIAEALERIATAIELQNKSNDLPETEPEQKTCIGDRTSL